jgi:hypothetical protein
MQSTEAMQNEETIGLISMRVERSAVPVDESSRSGRAEALARWLLDQWRQERTELREAC